MPETFIDRAKVAAGVLFSGGVIGSGRDRVRVALEVLRDEHVCGALRKHVITGTRSGLPLGSLMAPGSGAQDDQRINGNPYRALDDYYSWLWKAVTTLAEHTSSIGIEYSWASAQSDEPKPVLAHEALERLARPNRWMRSEWELRFATIASLGLFGNALWYLPTEGRQTPVAIWLIPWQYVDLKTDRNTGDPVYMMQTGSGWKRLPTEEVVHMRWPDLANPHRGRAPASAAGLAIDMNSFAQKSNVAFFKHGLRSNEIIESDEETTDAVVDDFYRELQERHGGIYNFHWPIVLPSGWKMGQRGRQGDTDIDFKSALELARDEILAMYNVPKAIIGLTSDFNRANMEAAIFAFQWGAVRPQIVRYCEILEREVLPRWAPPMTAEWRCGYVPFIIKDRATDIMEMKARLGEGSGRAITTQNEERAWMGLDPVDSELADMLTKGTGVLGNDEQPQTAGALAFSAEATKRHDLREQQMIVWRQFSRLHRKHELATLRVLQSSIVKQRDAVVKRLRIQLPKSQSMTIGLSTSQAREHLRTHASTKKALFDPTSEGERMFRDVSPNLAQTAEAAAKETGRMIGVTVRVESAIDNSRTHEAAEGVALLPVDDIVAYIETLALDRLVDMNTNVLDSLTDLIADRVSAGRNVDEIVSEIMDRYEDIEEHVAFRFTRTATTGAWSWASQEAAKNSGLELRKSWIPAGDARTRDTHIAAGEKYGPGSGIKLDKAFQVGGSRLEFPGDPSGDPSEIYHCRCTLIYEVQ